ncbi:hypothetical protein PRNP1_007433 [Phytophthora ramorum]
MQQPPELLAYKALQAVQRGNAEELAKLIQAGANAHVINAVVKSGTSPNGRPDREAKSGLLYHAVDKQNVDMVKVLLSNGAEVNGSKQDESPPPLRAAVVRRNLELVTLLLKRGANVDRKYAITTGSDRVTTTVLFEPTSEAVYNFLLRRGGDVNIKDSKGDSPLHVQADKWNASLVNGLVEHGADVNALDKENRTALERALQQWDFKAGCNEEEDLIDVCHTLMSHKAMPPHTDLVASKPERKEQLLNRLQLVKEWAAQRDVGMVVLSHVPVEIYRRGLADITAYFAANTLVPVAVEHSEVRTEAIPDAPRRQTKTGVPVWTSGEEVLQRKVEILPALDRALSSRMPVPSSDDISPFLARHDPASPLLEEERRPTRANSFAWTVREEVAPGTADGAEAAAAEKPVGSIDPVSSFSGPAAALCVNNSAMTAEDPPIRSSPIVCEPLGPVISGSKAALPPISPRPAPLPPVSSLQLYRLKMMCASDLRRVLKYRRQNPYCICRLVRGNGEILAEVQTAVHPGGGQVPTWHGQVFELALTTENTMTCTLVFILKHSGVVTSLDERIAMGMMPFPYIPLGHSLKHKLLLMNNDKVAGRLEIHLEAY